jgi:hypothetical protein
MAGFTIFLGLILGRLYGTDTTNTFSMDVACPNLANKQTNKQEHMNCMVTTIFATANTINMHN